MPAIQLNFFKYFYSTIFLTHPLDLAIPIRFTPLIKSECKNQQRDNRDRDHYQPAQNAESSGLGADSNAVPSSHINFRRPSCLR